MLTANDCRDHCKSYTKEKQKREQTLKSGCFPHVRDYVLDLLEVAAFEGKHHLQMGFPSSYADIDRLTSDLTGKGFTVTKAYENELAINW